jgi:DNA mismatch endonuclease (patch repair protein)
MADVVSPEIRSRMMSGIRGKNTKPEMAIRRGLHQLGFRFRLHRNTLPGKPDLVFSRYEAALIVNGCFWHGHDCSLFKWPSSRPDFWRGKIEENRKRDIRNHALLDALGWRQLIVWECALKGRNRLPLDVVLTECASWLKGSARGGEIREI